MPGRYSHFDADPMRRAANAVAASLAAAMKEPGGDQAPNVSSFRKG
jgi:hypothetical protein